MHSTNSQSLLRFEIYRVVLLNILVFMDVTLCTWVRRYWHFEALLCLRVQGHLEQVLLAQWHSIVSQRTGIFIWVFFSRVIRMLEHLSYIMLLNSEVLWYSCCLFQVYIMASYTLSMNLRLEGTYGCHPSIQNWEKPVQCLDRLWAMRGQHGSTQIMCQVCISSGLYDTRLGHRYVSMYSSGLYGTRLGHICVSMYSSGFYGTRLGHRYVSMYSSGLYDTRLGHRYVSMYSSGLYGTRLVHTCVSMYQQWIVWHQVETYMSACISSGLYSTRLGHTCVSMYQQWIVWHQVGTYMCQYVRQWIVWHQVGTYMCQYVQQWIVWHQVGTYMCQYVSAVDYMAPCWDIHVSVCISSGLYGTRLGHICVSMYSSGLCGTRLGQTCVSMYQQWIVWHQVGTNVCQFVDMVRRVGS